MSSAAATSSYMHCHSSLSVRHVTASAVVRHSSTFGFIPSVPLMQGDIPSTGEGGKRKKGHLSNWTDTLLRRKSAKGQDEVIRQMESEGLTPTVSHWNILLNSRRTLTEKRKLMEKMNQSGVEMDVINWNTLLKSYKSPDMIRSVMAEMTSAGCTPDAVTWGCLMMSYGDDRRRGDVRSREVMAEAFASGIERDNIKLWNHLLRIQNSYVNSRSVFEEMKTEGVVPDRHSWLTLMKKSCYDPQQSTSDSQNATSSDGVDNGGDTNSKTAERNCDVVKKLFDEMVDSGIKPDVSTWNIVLFSHANCKSSPEVVRKLMEEMRKSGIIPDEYSWSALIRCYVQPPQIREAMEEMRGVGLKLNVTIWSLLLKSFNRPSAVNYAWKEMIADGVTPNSDTYSILFNIYLRCKHPQEVIHVFNAELKNRPYLINDYVANAIIRALADEGDVAEIINFWKRYSFKLTPKGITSLKKMSMAYYKADSLGWHAVRSLLRYKTKPDRRRAKQEAADE